MAIRKSELLYTIEEYLEKVEALKKEGKSVGLISEPTRYSIVVSEMGNLEIHPTIYAKCWDLYTNRRYDDAIVNATKALEVAIRTKARLSDDIVGAALVNRAFKPDKPILRYNNIEAEQEGMMSLLRGIIQVFKNPQSHRFVGVQSKSECLGVLLTCSNLLYVIENAEYVG